MASHLPSLARRAALPTALLLLSLSLLCVRAQRIEGGPYAISPDCPAKHLTEETFEHDTQASSGMTSGNWLVLFVPSNEGATAQHYSQQAVHEIETFESFLKAPSDVLDTYHVVAAYVLCDESPALCRRFNVDEQSSKLTILADSRLFPYPGEHVRTVDDIELFVTIFRRIQSSKIPPVRPAGAVWGQLLLLVVGVVGIVLVRSYSLNRMSGPLPKGMAPPPPPHSKSE